MDMGKGVFFPQITGIFHQVAGMGGAAPDAKEGILILLHFPLLLGRNQIKAILLHGHPRLPKGKSLDITIPVELKHGIDNAIIRQLILKIG